MSGEGFGRPMAQIPRMRVLSQRLAERIDELVAELLPAGVRRGSEWRVGSLNGERGSSLSVCLRGPKRGLWHDFATGEAGDALALVSRTRCSGNLLRAAEWARWWLGLPAHDRQGLTRRAREEPRAEDEETGSDTSLRTAKAFAVWRSCLDDGLSCPNDWGLPQRRWRDVDPRQTPTACYLRARGIEIDSLPRWPRALRFHPALFCPDLGRAVPAMVAAFVNANGYLVGVHRTFLERDADGRWIKARIRNPKLMLGAVRGAFIPIWRGSVPGPFHEIGPREHVLVAEGIENALSIAVSCPEHVTIAAGSLVNFKAIELPPLVRRVTLCVDNDDGPLQREIVRLAAERLARRLPEVRIARPEAGFKDFNDWLIGARTGQSGSEVRAA